MSTKFSSPNDNDISELINFLISVLFSRIIYLNKSLIPFNEANAESVIVTNEVNKELKNFSASSFSYKHSIILLIESSANSLALLSNSTSLVLIICNFSFNQILVLGSDLNHSKILGNLTLIKFLSF
ncbi:Uncharacterised protein [Chlamydia abortus]|nr:Uncharacterised protein [Chlamydia abortus]